MTTPSDSKKKKAKKKQNCRIVDNRVKLKESEKGDNT